MSAQTKHETSAGLSSQGTAIRGKTLGIVSTPGWSPGSKKKQAPCVLCEELHPLYQCWGFRNMSVAERWKAATKAKVCYSCLDRNHTARQCRTANRICGHDGCTESHSKWLHGPGKRGGEARMIVAHYDPDDRNKRVKMDPDSWSHL